eukprot:SM000365S13723  [mRNA]  locus=s365:74139:78529:+ [translate_table: standard]
MPRRPPPAGGAALLQLLAAALLVSSRPADSQVVSSEGVWKIIDFDVTYSPVHVIVNRFDVLEFIFFHIPGFLKYPGSPNTVGNAEYTITGDVGTTSKFTYCDSDFFLNPTPQACTAYHCGWSRIAMLIAGRWYPSVQRIADGRIFICGGNDIEQLPGVSDEMGRASIPNYEYFPVHSGDTVHNLSLLVAPNKDTYYVSSYPLVHLINLGPSSSKLFILSNVSSVLLDTNSDTCINLPDMPYPSHSRNYPFSAASAVLPLSSRNGWLSEVLICGGTSNSAAALQNPGKPPKSGLVPASDNCGRISPALGASAEWEMEVMPSPRILGSLNILADGTLLLSCGVKAGRAHLTQQWMGDPNLFPMLYVPGHSAGSRMRELQANATIPRGYHTVVTTFVDGRVLVAGSNPNPGNNVTTQGLFPTNLIMQAYLPPYLTSGSVQPVLTGYPSSFTYRQPFGITGLVEYHATTSSLQAAILDPGHSTHSLVMGQAFIWLDLTDVVLSPGEGEMQHFAATAVPPPSQHVAIPGFYMLFVLDRGTPCTRAASGESIIVGHEDTIKQRVNLCEWILWLHELLGAIEPAASAVSDGRDGRVEVGLRV